MSTVSIHCPNCGSTNTSEIKADQYQCNACKAQFNFVRPQDRFVTQDIRTHNCPVCGRAVQAGHGNLCKNCGTGDICEGCVEYFRNKGLVCRNCIVKEGKDCYNCGSFSSWICASCTELYKRGKIKNVVRACDKHSKKAFWVFDKSNNFGYVYRTFECGNCGGMVCKDCVSKEKRLMVKTKLVCENCKSELKGTEHFLAS